MGNAAEFAATLLLHPVSLMIMVCTALGVGGLYLDLKRVIKEEKRRGR